jgi:hypothetical protein
MMIFCSLLLFTLSVFFLWFKSRAAGEHAYHSFFFSSFKTRSPPLRLFRLLGKLRCQMTLESKPEFRPGCRAVSVSVGIYEQCTGQAW